MCMCVIRSKVVPSTDCANMPPIVSQVFAIFSNA